MIREVINWWKTLAWYWRGPALVAVVGVIIIGLVQLFGKGLGTLLPQYPARTATRQQVATTDALHREQTDRRIADTEAEIHVSQQRTEELDVRVRKYQKERERIEKEAVEILKSLEEEPDFTIAELNKWRKERGI